MEKKYYWIKLRTDFFNQETIDFLLSQKNGCEYIVLYQMLCLNTANNNGKMETKVGELIIPYDINKIARDTKYFDYDTIAVALELFKQLGLIYEEENQILRISNIERMIGSESASREAIKKREQRLKQKIKENEGTQEGTNCLIENRDKILDIRYNIKKENIKEKKQTFGTFKRVKLTEEEYSRLANEFGKEFIDNKINQLDEYLESNNNKNKYTNFNLVLRKAIRENWFNKNSFKKENDVPDWFTKDIQKQSIDQAEEQELQKMIKNAIND